MPAIRVIIADDHTLVRAGIRSLLEQGADIDVVAEASDGREAVELAEAHQPDLVLMDITMSEMNGLEATRRIMNAAPDARVLILSVHKHEEYVWQALRAGASGYLLKEAMPAELEVAVRAVARGERYLSPPVSTQVIDAYIDRVGGEPGPFERLTPRQREVLQLIAEGHTTKEIAAHLHVSAKTVESHRTNLMKSLDIHDIAGLVRYAIRVGLVSPRD